MNVSLQNNNEDRNLSERIEVIQGSVGSGIHRKLILGTGAKEKRLRWVGSYVSIRLIGTILDSGCY